MEFSLFWGLLIKHKTRYVFVGESRMLLFGQVFLRRCFDPEMVASHLGRKSMGDSESESSPVHDNTFKLQLIQVFTRDIHCFQPMSECQYWDSRTQILVVTQRSPKIYWASSQAHWLAPLVIYLYHQDLNPGLAMFDRCFMFHFASLPLGGRFGPFSLPRAQRWP